MTHSKHATMTEANTIVRALKAFMVSPARNTWLPLKEEGVPMIAYVRKGFHLVHVDDKEARSCLDLASFEVEEVHRGRGLLRTLVQVVEDTARSHGLCIYIENVLDEKLQVFFANTRSYKRVDLPGLYSACYWKIP